jgi:2,6-dihydroxypyridine 3-monooxygenase
MYTIAIIGGSLGGLTAALTLRDLGCAVTIYERSPKALVGLGAGIVLNPVTVRYLVERRGIDLNSISVRSRVVRYLNTQGEIAHEQAVNYRFSSYNALYRGLLDAFSSEHYLLGSNVEGFTTDGSGATISLTKGGTAHYDLLVCADGVRSAARKIIAPEAVSGYAGYVAWRGTIPPTRLSSATAQLLNNAICYYLMPNSHLLTYPIPMVDQADAGAAPHLNWLWYRNIPAGPALDALLTDRHGQRREVSVPADAVAPEQQARLQADAAHLPPPLAELVAATETPFVQAIVDTEVERMVHQRACLIGDAAFVARPHAAAGSAKAAADAWALAEAVAACSGDLAMALASWQTQQLDLGRNVLARTRAVGQRMQFTNGWHIGDPLPFGLYTIGDSEME